MSNPNPFNIKEEYFTDEESQDASADEMPSTSASAGFSQPKREPLINNDDSDDETLFKKSIFLPPTDIDPPSPKKPEMKQAASRGTEILEEILIADDDTLPIDIKTENGTEDDWLPSDEVETSYVVVDLHGFIDEKQMVERVNKGPCRVRHPMTERPIVQLQGQLYSGKYRESNGTIMIMHKEANPNASYKLLATSNIILDARQSYLYAKSGRNKDAAGLAKRAK